MSDWTNPTFAAMEVREVIRDRIRRASDPHRARRGANRLERGA
jgi:hypothetical protein